ncbi:arabinogalactan protein 1-like isoform X1 [Panicum virgatum]|uniref:arabinogalactan protein 1-like isoform X1 n=1 Tax=Panicum virgatum TaxID=38727 RepID=UPI0019D5554E|nr:arabinogalactan protein 1-like isoform X1 [Panicum virgatum]XP_039813324.1 arabinogalactan protein 1-like isoform X1 [Panicum virgatum]
MSLYWTASHMCRTWSLILITAVEYVVGLGEGWPPATGTNVPDHRLEAMVAGGATARAPARCAATSLRAAARSAGALAPGPPSGAPPSSSPPDATLSRPPPPPGWAAAHRAVHFRALSLSGSSRSPLVVVSPAMEPLRLPRKVSTSTSTARAASSASSASTSALATASSAAASLAALAAVAAA